MFLLGGFLLPRPPAERRGTHLEDEVTQNQPAISVRGLTKKYGSKTAVDDISFDVEAGSVFAFLGTNGAGKSTTIGCVTTVTPFDAGTVEVSGHNVRSAGELVRRDIGVVFQDSVLDPLLTGRENLRVRARFYSSDKAKNEARIRELAELVELQEFVDRRYGTYSAGSGAVWILPAPCCMPHPSSSSTNPPPGWTPPAGRSSGKPSTTCGTGTD